METLFFLSFMFLVGVFIGGLIVWVVKTSQELVEKSKRDKMVINYLKERIKNEKWRFYLYSGIYVP